MKHILKKFCSPEWIDFINFHSKKVTKKAGEKVFKAGDEVLGLYIIETGKVKVTITSPTQEEVVVRFATDDEIVGHRGLGGDWTYPINAVCYTDSILNFIPLRILNTLIMGNPQFAYQMIMFFANELRSAEYNQSQETVRQRIVKVLLTTAETFGMDEKIPTKIAFTIPRKDIASKAQTTYESVIRTLSELNKEEIILLEKKDIHLINMNQLKRIAQKGE